MTVKNKPMALDAGPPASWSPTSQAYFAKCREKLGFVPNVLEAYAFDNAKLRAFILMADDLMLGDSGLSKLEREMIAVAVSSVNHCHYCLTSHGAAVRQRGNDPELGELIAQNYRAADLPPRQKAMLDFAVKLTEAARQDRGDRSRERCARPDSAIATSGISPPSPLSTTCRTGWPPRPTCGPTASTTTWCASNAAEGAAKPPRHARLPQAAGHESAARRRRRRRGKADCTNRRRP